MICFDILYCFKGKIDIIKLYKFYWMLKTCLNLFNISIVYLLIIFISVILFSNFFSYFRFSVMATPTSNPHFSLGNENTMIASPSCGEVVKGDVKLISNLVCNGDGLIVGADNTKINLNGFSIKGPGINSNKVGIMVGAENNIIVLGNGVISGFQSGIYISGSNNIIAKNVNMINNKVAIYLTGVKSADINNNMINNNTIGIASHSNKDETIRYNLFNENNLTGITFINSHNSTIEGNNLINTTNGIFLDAQSSMNKVNFNNLFNNVLDINNANNLPLNINNNYYANNNCMTSLPSGLCIGR